MPANPNLLTSPKQRHGSLYEGLARDFLREQGLQIVVQNWQQPKVGELDLVCVQVGRSWDVLVFVEVRKRKQLGFGDAFASVTPAKQRKLIKTAHHFLQQHPQYAKMECRFDVVAFNETANSRYQNSSPMNKIDIDNEVPVAEWVQGAFVAQAW